MTTKYFSTDWFSHNIDNWKILLEDLKNKPNIYGLEIGVFQGRSTCWLLDNIFTHETAKFDAVDTFEGNVEMKGMIELKNLYETFSSNTEEYISKLITYKMKGSDFLRNKITEVYDFIYIDGDHHAWSCLEDMILSWSKLKVNGIMIIDDYGGGEPNEEQENLVRTGVNCFLVSFKTRYEIKYSGYQIALIKIF